MRERIWQLGAIAVEKKPTQAENRKRTYGNIQEKGWTQGKI